MEETIAQNEKRAQTKGQESSLKIKFKAEGKKYTEPKLESKKYRRVSRKVSNQKLENLPFNFPDDIYPEK